MAGRRPIPTQLKAIRGTLRKDRVNAAEPQPTRGIPACPRWLGAEAKREYRRVAPMLDATGVLTELDGLGLAVLVDTYVDVQQLAQLLQEKGRTYETPSGSIRGRPEFGQLHQAKAVLRSWAIEYGITPASRSRLKAHASEEADPLEELVNRAKQRA